MGATIDHASDLDLITIPSLETNTIFRATDVPPSPNSLPAGRHSDVSLENRDTTITPPSSPATKCARWPVDRRERPLAAWLSRLYGAFPDHGLSPWRPWAWWLATVVPSTLAYWDLHIRILGGRPPFTACVVGGDTRAFEAAILFALHQGSIFGNLGRPPGTGWITRCLFGEDLPGLVLVLAGLQSLLSAVLLLFFLLAVRNHFRIR